MSEKTELNLIDWLNKVVKLEKKVFSIQEDFGDFYLYFELFKKLDIMDEDDWNKYVR